MLLLPEPAWHAIVVADVHAAVLQTACTYSPVMSCETSATDAVCTPTPKPSPVTVTENPEDEGTFAGSINDATEASKENTPRAVPATAPTLTDTCPKMSPTAFDKHATDVAELHDDVTHTLRSPPPPRSSAAVAVCSPAPKPSPDTVTDAYPL
jgi:hypothetical protein